MAKELQAYTAHAPVVVLTNTKLQTHLITTLPREMLPGVDESSKHARLQAWLRRIGRQTGSGSFRMLILPDGESSRTPEVRHLLEQGTFTDILGAEGTSAWWARPRKPDLFSPRRGARKASIGSAPAPTAAPEPTVKPAKPDAPDYAGIAARLRTASEPNKLDGGADPTPEEIRALGLHNYDDHSTLDRVLRTLFPGLSDKSYQSAMSRSFHPAIELYDSQKAVKETARMDRVRADREAAAVAKTKNFTPANAKVEPKGTRIKMDGRWSSRPDGSPGGGDRNRRVYRTFSRQDARRSPHSRRTRVQGPWALGKYLLEKLNGLIERGEPADLEPIRQATYAGGGRSIRSPSRRRQRRLRRMT
ncbi:MAG: hypothetical protein MZV65_32015 [Chromatiales bacterium]|nr:hypothetical protein [Chromatiales bacterium]